MTEMTTQWLYRVLEQDDDGDPLDFGAVSAASLGEATELVTAHLIDILGDDVWEELPVRFYPVTSTTGVWASDRPYTDTDLDLTTVLTVTQADDDPTRYNDPE